MVFLTQNFAILCFYKVRFWSFLSVFEHNAKYNTLGVVYNSYEYTEKNILKKYFEYFKYKITTVYIIWVILTRYIDWWVYQFKICYLREEKTHQDSYVPQTYKR